MKLASFRLRIALLSVALAGSALVGFGLVAWRLIYVAKVSSLDAKLNGQLQRMSLARSPDGWQEFARELPRELETQLNTPMIVLLADSEGQTQHYLVEEAQLGTVTLDIRSILRAKAEEIEDKQAKSIAEEASRGTLRKNARQVFSPNSQQVGNWRVGVVYDTLGQGAIAVSLQTINQDMAVIRNIFLVAIPSTLLLIAAGAWVLSGSALKPVRKLTRVIQKVTATGLDQQVPVGSADVEFVELIKVFNEMLVRLERSFKQSSRFSGDAAHELKTPLAILRGELELAMGQAEPGSALQQSLSQLMDEVSRLSTIVRKLLLLSLADAGQMSLRQAPVDIEEILSVLIEDIELLAPELPVTVDIEKGIKLRGDSDLLTQVMQNMIDNAIKYNLPEGAAGRWMSVTGRQVSGQVHITVANASRRLSEEDRDRIFDRFYRGDLSRNRKREGFGLGLSLSREIARAHKGDLQLDKTTTGETSFTLTLPALPKSAPKPSRKLTASKS